MPVLLKIECKWLKMYKLTTTFIFKGIIELVSPVPVAARSKA